MDGKVYRSYDNPTNVGYYVKSNHCNCHPETCACDDYLVCGQDGKRIASFFSESDAYNLVEVLNND